MSRIKSFWHKCLKMSRFIGLDNMRMLVARQFYDGLLKGLITLRNILKNKKIV